MPESIRELIERVLGPWGVEALRFYDSYSLPINLVVLLYGFVLVFSWRNLDGIRSYLVDDMARQMRQRLGSSKKTDPDFVLENVTIPWESALEQSRFPLVAQRWALLPRKRSLQSVRQLLTPEDLARDVLKRLA